MIEEHVRNGLIFFAAFLPAFAVWALCVRAYFHLKLKKEEKEKEAQ